MNKKVICKKPELLAPAANHETLMAAINAGCNAVYLGVEALNMRAKAKNFSSDELADIVMFCHQRNVDVHLTVNTIVYENELNILDEILDNAKESKVDLVICWDTAVIQKCIEKKIPFCISTQASVSNSSAANFYKNLGAKRIVLARECTIEMIDEIKQNTDIQIEAFIHGAMCLAVSGRCLLSHYSFGASANRGECIQPCRREFEIKDKDGEAEFIVDEDYVLSPKDLCTIDFIDKLIELGIDSFKIEGRKRSPEYISKVVSVYRKAIDLYFENKLTAEIKSNLKNELSKVYNRGFSNGFYFGRPGHEDYAEKYGSIATTKKVYIGKVLNYFKEPSVAHVKLEAGDLVKDDMIYIIGSNTGVVEMKIGQLIKDEIEINEGKKGDEITFKTTELIRPRDKVYKIVPA
ncbi:MAG: U32 family peptidase [Ignavibacteriales bacterium]|jgi:putative protease|nr:MAG: U32 family peptidase [Ignavibacteriales bacterium]